MSRFKLYSILAGLLLLGYLWLAWNLFHTHDTCNNLCLTKAIWGIPCPACGTSRALLLMLSGDWLQGLLTNPFGILAGLALTVTPLWLLYDLATRQASLLTAYLKTEALLKTRPIIYLPLIVITIANWIWNISKGL
jgi:hypothetical protein